RLPAGGCVGRAAAGYRVRLRLGAVYRPHAGGGAVAGHRRSRPHPRADPGAAVLRRPRVAVRAGRTGGEDLPAPGGLPAAAPAAGHACRWRATGPARPRTRHRFVDPVGRLAARPARRLLHGDLTDGALMGIYRPDGLRASTAETTLEEEQATRPSPAPAEPGGASGGGDGGTGGGRGGSGGGAGGRKRPSLGIKGWLRWIWRQLTSMRVALLLLLLLAAVALPGAFFPQRSVDPQQVTQYFTDHPDQIGRA